MGYIGVTDNAWLDFHQRRNDKRAIFWRKAPKPLRLKNGSKFFFLRKQRRSISGYGIIEDAAAARIRDLWDQFGYETGAKSLQELVQKVKKPARSKVGYYRIRNIRYAKKGIAPQDAGVQFERTTVSGMEISREDEKSLIKELGPKGGRKSGLTVEEIVRVAGLMKNTFKYLRRLREESSLANEINYPKIPSTLSESLVLRLLRNRRILKRELKKYEFRFDKRVADIVAIKANDVKKIEVKGSAGQGFQHFGPKDVKADYLIWIDFGSYFSGKNRGGKIGICIVPAMEKFFKCPCWIQLPKFKERCELVMIQSEAPFKKLVQWAK